MSIKPLPKKLVKRLQKAGPTVDRLMGAFKNADAREITQYLKSKYDTRELGGRVRELNVSRNFPNTELILKRAHPVLPKYVVGIPFLEARMQKAIMQGSMVTLTADETIRAVKTIVKQHNKLYTPNKYFLIEPKAYAIEKQIIAMSKTNAITMKKMEDPLIAGPISEIIAKKNDKLPKQVITEIETAMHSLFQRTGWTEGNVLFVGYKKGLPVFMPQVDLI